MAKQVRGKRNAKLQTVRCNLALPQASMTSVENIRAKTGAPSTTEVVRRALAFYEMALANQDAGARVVLRDKNGNDMPVIIL